MHSNESPIEWLYSRGLLDEARFQVANRFRGYYDRLAAGSMQSLDPGKIRVDGGRASDDLPARRLDAARRVSEVVQFLGLPAAGLLNAAIDPRRSFAEITAQYADNYALPKREARGFIRGRLCEALDRLGEFWNMLEAKGPAWSSIVGGLTLNSIAAE